MVADVLGGRKHAVCQRLKKHARLDESGDRLESETTDRFHLPADFSQLRNPLRVEGELNETVEILTAGVLAMGRPERLPDRLPNTVFELGVGRIRYRVAGLVIRGDLRDRVTSRAILSVSK